MWFNFKFGFDFLSYLALIDRFFLYGAELKYAAEAAKSKITRLVLILVVLGKMGRYA